MSPGQMLPGQMTPRQLESVLDVPRSLPLKFHQNQVSNSWDITAFEFMWWLGGGWWWWFTVNLVFCFGPKVWFWTCDLDQTEKKFRVPSLCILKGLADLQGLTLNRGAAPSFNLFHLIYFVKDSLYPPLLLSEGYFLYYFNRDKLGLSCAKLRASLNLSGFN